MSDKTMDDGTSQAPVDGAGVDISTVSAEDDVIRTLDIDDSQPSSCTGDTGNGVSDVNHDDSKDNSRTCGKKLTDRLVTSSGEERNETVSNDIQHDESEHKPDNKLEHVEDDGSKIDIQKADDIGDKNSAKINHCTDVAAADNSDTKASDSEVDLDMSVDDVSDNNSKHNNSEEKTPTKNNKENNCDDSFEKNTSDQDDDVSLNASHKKVLDNLEERRPRNRRVSEPSGKDVESTTSVLKEKLLQGSASKQYDCKDDDEDYDDDEIDISGIDVSQDDFEVVATPPTKKRQKKKKSQFGMQMQKIPPSVTVADKYYKPFEHDWGREIVIRNTYEEVTPSGKLRSRPSDVYYFTPEKTKLRSMVQITEYLYQTHSPLTIDNFTFQKDPIYKEPYEIVRMAGSHGRRGRPSGSHKSPQPAKSASKKQPKTSPKVVTVSPVVTTASPRILGKKVTSVMGKVVAAHADVIKVVPSSSASEKKPVIRAVAKKHMGKRGPSKSAATCSMVAPPALKKTKVDDDASRGKEAAGRLCGMDCPGRQGVPPSLHCEMCMCMFHPECVGYSDRSSRGGFICKACQTVSSSLQDKKGTNSSLAPGTAVSIVAPPPPPLVRAPTAATSPIIKVSPQRLRVNALPHDAIVIARAGVSLAQSKSAVNGVSGVPSIRFITPHKNSSQVSGQLLTLPPGVTTKLNLKQPLQLRMGGNTFVIPPSCFISTADSVKVLLPPGCLSQGAAQSVAIKANDLNVCASAVTSSSQEISVNSLESRTLPVQLQQPPQLQPSPRLQQTLPQLQQLPLLQPPPQLQPAPQLHQSLGLQRTSKQKPVLCYFQRLHVGFDCMMHIFQYLPVADLLRAGRVCRTWRNVVSHNSLWRTVHLTGVTVVDWHHATLRLQCHNTQTLDLRGILHGDGDSNRTWHQVTAVLGQLTRLQHLVFGQCPATVLHTVTHFLTQLQSLTAEFISDDRTAEAQTRCCSTKLDVGKFSKLNELRSLRLRGTNGLTLPAFSFTGGLTQLADLTHLHTLCLTTLRDVPHEEFNFLGSLINLEVLHLGDCTSWTSETYSQLGKLEKLRVLKLMSGGQIPDSGLGDALKKFPSLEQLELIEYVIAENLADILKSLSQLKTFSVWTNTETRTSEVNTWVLQAVAQMTCLKQFEWGVTCENVDGVSLAVTPSDGSPQKMQCIAVLPSLAAGPQPMFDATSPANYISINKVVDYMGGFLPHTNIRVFQVPPTRRTA